MCSKQQLPDLPLEVGSCLHSVLPPANFSHSCSQCGPCCIGSGSRCSTLSSWRPLQSSQRSWPNITSQPPIVTLLVRCHVLPCTALYCHVLPCTVSRSCMHAREAESHLQIGMIAMPGLEHNTHGKRCCRLGLTASESGCNPSEVPAAPSPALL